ncbi:hypothetical protein LCGC14_2201430 [marine sediment metagenome]|uniref:Uncharacterized protein n=1 Tax=marine sediment metagenome TaxID=412755 RepID=A0A0F9DGL3_9ZZZZ
MKMKTKDVIEALKKINGLEFDPKAKYSDLCKLLNDSKPKESKEDLRVKEIHKKRGFPGNVIRDAKKAGFTYEQIESFVDEEALNAAMYRIKPSLLASAGVITKPRPPKPPVEMEIKEPLKIHLEISPMRAKTRLRADDEQRAIDVAILKAHLRQNVVSIEISREYTPQENNKYVTNIEIYYRGPK